MTKSKFFYKKGDVVDVPFPYQDDPKKQKHRPVVILATDLSKQGFIYAYITSNSIKKPGIIEIRRKDFREGYINNNYQASYVRPDRICTLNKEVITKKYGTLKDDVMDEIIKTLTNLLQNPPETPSFPKSIERPKKKKNF